MPTTYRWELREPDRGRFATSAEKFDVAEWEESADGFERVPPLHKIDTRDVRAPRRRHDALVPRGVVRDLTPRRERALLARLVRVRVRARLRVRVRARVRATLTLTPTCARA